MYFPMFLALAFAIFIFFFLSSSDVCRSCEAIRPLSTWRGLSPSSHTLTLHDRTFPEPPLCSREVHELAAEQTSAR